MMSTLPVLDMVPFRNIKYNCKKNIEKQQLGLLKLICESILNLYLEYTILNY